MIMFQLLLIFLHRYAVVVSRSGNEYYANINAATFRVIQIYNVYCNHYLNSLVDHRALLVLRLLAVQLLLPVQLLQLAQQLVIIYYQCSTAHACMTSWLFVLLRIFTFFSLFSFLWLCLTLLPPSLSLSL